MRLASPLAAAALVALAAAAHAQGTAPSAAPSAPSPAPAPPAPSAPSLRFERFELSNGLEVILHEDHRVPVVAVNVAYHVGAKDEPPGQSGLAELVKHLMFQGSRHVGEDMFLRYVERAGASDRGATTTADRTTYEETVPSNQLELALWLESDRMAWMLDHLDASVLAAQRDAVKTERRERTDNAPYGLVGSLLREALYPTEHPYHRALGAPAQGEAIALDDVRGFFRTYYVPNDATLVLAGDFDPALAKALVAQYFGPIPRGADASLARPAPVSIPGEKRLDVAANVELARVAVAWHAPPAFAPGHAELALLTSLLARGRASRLYEHLVYDRQMAESVSAKLTEGQLGSVFEIVATLRRGKTAEEALAVIDQVLDDLRSQPPAFTEMERAAAYTVADATFPLDRASGRAAALARAAQLAGDPAMFSRLLERVQRAQPADVTAAAATWLPRDRRVVALVHADPGAPRAGQLVGSR